MHILGFSMLLGAAAFNAAQVPLWLLVTALSGLGLLLIDLYGSFIVLFQVRGASVLLKIAATLALPLFWGQDSMVWLLVFLIVFSSLVSHATRGLRHRSLLPLRWRIKLDPAFQQPDEGRV